jgi:hypothetical protein
LVTVKGSLEHTQHSKKQVEETLEHPFLVCPFALDCWNLIHLLIPQGAPHYILLSLKSQLQVNFFMDIIILRSWTIWMARNDLIFRGEQPSLQVAAQRFKSEFAVVILRAKMSRKYQV